MERQPKSDEPSEACEFATLAGGCFWCLEAVFDELEGVAEVVSGYTGGHVAEPAYRDVCAGATGHAEAVRLSFDPGAISYRELLEVFFAIHDPTTKDRQGNDVGSQYRSAIYYHSPQQKAEAEALMGELAAQRVFAAPIVTELAPAGIFYPAEDYHQEYAKKNPVRYGFYRATCGRDRRLKEVWGRTSERP